MNPEAKRFIAWAAVLGCLVMGAGCSRDGRLLSGEFPIPVIGRFLTVVSTSAWDGTRGLDRIEEIAVPSGQRRVVYRHEGGRLYDPGLPTGQIAGVDETTIIVTSPEGLLLIDTERRQRARVLGEGISPVYFPVHEKLMYLRVRPDPRGYRLHEATLRDGRLEHARVVDERPMHGTLVAISDHELLVWRRSPPYDRYTPGPYMKYDVRTGAREDTALDACTVEAWRSKTREFICLDRDGSHRMLVDLDGRRRAIPGLEHHHIRSYVAHGDYLLASWWRPSLIASRGRQYLVALDFSSSGVHLIANDIFYVGPDRRDTWSLWIPGRGES